MQKIDICLVYQGESYLLGNLIGNKKRWTVTLDKKPPFFIPEYTFYKGMVEKIEDRH